MNREKLELFKKWWISTEMALLIYLGILSVLIWFHVFIDFISNPVRGSQLHLMPESKHSLHLHFVNKFDKLAEDFLH